MHPSRCPSPGDAHQLLDLPNVGPHSADDLIQLGITEPQQLAGRDPFQLYQELCRITGQRQDPCVLDVLISAVRYIDGEGAKPWWTYTAERKALLTGAELLGQPPVKAS
ncbi:helix-hairpin-helix domain-containing protein [Crenobacter sp. SG2305]|uniref:helix-hairpin-helix domain-containing protein n=1 Tax=Crenobacter oryzisoli TaxID=3056844 RepID=UPI0025AB41FD|nr:helix-hairpin-helix domain-containing protein [Crenobacter sp. SG2305]MDN0082969.1 helix-hairpin-helix domain-containing protein [Crenobacter sp. SG2305]